MRSRGRRLGLAIAVAATAGFALATAYALGAGEISSSATCTPGCSYSSPTFTITAGQVAQFHNATTTGGFYGGTSHNVTANDRFAGAPLFGSATIPSQSTTSVKGTQYLAPGDYVFHCTIHGPSMSATLHVAGGTPLARPRIAVKIASRKLRRVRRSGRLKVKVRDEGSDATGVSLKATRGGKRIARKSGVSVAAGTTKPVKLKLRRKARRGLRGLDEAKIKLTGTVPFGPPAKAKRILR